MSGLAKLNKPSVYINNDKKEDTEKKKGGISKLKAGVAESRSKYDVGESELTSLIDDMILKEREREKQGRGVRKGKFNPSSVGETCDRLQYLIYHGMLPPENHRDARSIRVLSNGNSLEDRFFKYFTKLNIYREKEKRVEVEIPPMSGRIDYIIQIPNREHITLVELKTINDRGFASLNAPKPEHSTQLQCYLNMLGVPHGIVMYENKNSQAFKEFHIHKDEDLWNGIVERCDRIMQMTELPNIPKIGHSRFCGCRAYGKDSC